LPDADVRGSRTCVRAAGAPGEVEEGGRSGFWTSRRPAKGGAYRYRLMGIGVVILLITGYGTLRLIKRTQPPKR